MFSANVEEVEAYLVAKLPELHVPSPPPPKKKILVTFWPAGEKKAKENWLFFRPSKFSQGPHPSNAIQRR